ncbi:serine hydrolase domain-containing protein [Reyranella sp.]|uniref:serine hydrolase domain-containing protein n=1 Tax=Reyranella sp. TaxID=1929291 RepID=UPI003D0B83B3
MHRSISIVSLAVMPILLTGCGSLDRATGVATGFVSHQLCSAAFVSGVEPETFYRESIAPTLGPVEFLVSHRLDRERAEVTATFAGLAPSRSVYRGPLGCLVLRGNPPAPVSLPQASAFPALLPPIAGPEPVEPADPALRAALDRAFTERSAPPLRQTKAIVVVHNGRVIAERYAPGYTMDTPLPGWSATKSVTNALLGILVRQGKIAVQGPAPVAAWTSPGDPRHAISVDNLLRMSSGLDCGQSLTASARDAFDPSAHMVFGERDMAAFAASLPLKATPGTDWTYTNCNTLLLSQIIREKTGGDAAAVIAFARRELFDKLGMQHVTLEFDAVGTPIGASHMFASARDWARFGLLYLDDGVAGNERLLPEGWVDYSATMTPGSEEFGYAAGFWTNRGPGSGTHYRIAHGIPADAFMARGAYGQYIVVVPSQRLVVARFGTALDMRNDMDGVARLVADVIALTPRSQAATVRP